MPELPEVTTIVNQLKKEIVGKKISSVFVNKTYKTTPAGESFENAIINSIIIGVDRVAKVIVVTLEKASSRKFLALHLAMTGLVRLYKRDTFSKGLVVFCLDDGSRFVFTDQRRFGYVQLFEKMETLENKYGPDPFKITASDFAKIIKSKSASWRTNIKNALLDQRLIAGIGNIYVNEALFMAKIHPQTKTAAIATGQLAILLAAIKDVLARSITHRGSTLSDLTYTDIYGNYGEFQTHFKIYGRKGETCEDCKTKIEFIMLNGRGTYFCPVCQN